MGRMPLPKVGRVFDSIDELDLTKPNENLTLLSHFGI